MLPFLISQLSALAQCIMGEWAVGLIVIVQDVVVFICVVCCALDTNIENDVFQKAVIWMCYCHRCCSQG